MIKKIFHFLKLSKNLVYRLEKNLNKSNYYAEKVKLGFLRTSAVANLRKINPTEPLSWSFSAFSSSNEDGIIDFLSKNLINQNNYFIEIGAGNGIDNNTAWLAIARKFNKELSMQRGI